MCRASFRTAIALASLLAVGCGGGSGTVTSPSATSIAGTWTGAFADTILGPNPSTWVVQQSSSAVSGTFTIQAPLATGKGTISGTISGTTVTWSGAIAAGGFPAPFQNCVGTASGTLQLSGTKLTGPYSLQSGSGCSPPNINSTGPLCQ